MGQVLHGCAKTTEAMRRDIQNSEESIMKLAKRYSIAPNTVIKWRKRDYVHDSPMGPKVKRSTVLTPEEEAVCVAFRKHTLLPLDDCLFSLQEIIPNLTRSSLHRLFQRSGISQLPKAEPKIERKKFKSYPIGYFHIDITEVRSAEGKLHLFVAIDRTSKLAYVELKDRAGKMEAAQFLSSLIKAIPYKIEKILTDNGIQFTNRSCDRHAMTHIFDRMCESNSIEHRVTQVKHPWTNGQVERMNRTIQEATVNKYYYEDHEELDKHIRCFIEAYNYGKRLKTLKGLTPYEYILKIWEDEPERFAVNPHHHTSGPYSLGGNRIDTPKSPW
jgi:transposase-like protein